MNKTFKESFRRYEHPFDHVIEAERAIRRLKSELGIGNKRIECATIQIQNDENKLAVILSSVDGIMHQCKCDSLIVEYIDDSDSNNNLSFKF
jgi:isopentenyldiphosphate isomerase